MKSLHKPGLFSWSEFNAQRNIDFNSFFIQGKPIMNTLDPFFSGEMENIVIDPLPLSDHDKAHIRALGGIDWILLSNSDHCRAAAEIAVEFEARIAGPKAEAANFPIVIDRWLSDGDVFMRLQVRELKGSKTPGELCFRYGSTLFTGDLIRAHKPGELIALPAQKLRDPLAAARSIQDLDSEGVDTVLVGDGWHLFGGGAEAIDALCQSLLERYK
jgi:glyoxylase-like metal-dependent hydrolase (beta-lactamase superfamily II)